MHEPGSVLRVGVLGAANIARGFIAGVAPSSSVVVAAVASRSAEKAAHFAQDNGVARFYGSYDALLADPDIDAIYNPLPNSLHAEWSIRACEAGKHVLCEKPLCVSGAQAEQMFAAARRAGVFLREAYPYRAQPQTIHMLQMVQAGAIGELQLIQASFGFSLASGPNIRAQADLAGGSLLDAGTYPVSLVCTLAGRRPARVTAVANWSGGVDHALAATLHFTGGLIAQVTSSFATSVHRQALIAGSRGVIQTAFSNHPPLDQPAAFLLKQGIPVTVDYQPVLMPALNGFRAEAESFAQLVRGEANGWNGVTPQQSVDIAYTLAAILDSARRGVAVELPSA